MTGAMRWLAAFGRDLRHAGRSLLRMPALSAVVVLSLGVGIGLNTAVFAWVRAIVFRPLPGVEDASSFRLVMPRTEAGVYPGASWPEYLELSARLPSVRALLAFRAEPLEVGELGQAERKAGLLVSGNYFTALGLEPAAGRFLGPDEVTAAGGAPVVVLSHDYWMAGFQGSAGVIGRRLRVNNVDLTIIGVAPRGFRGTTIGLVTDVWVPATLTTVLRPGSTELERWESRGWTLMGRPVAGAGEGVIRDELRRAMADFAVTRPATHATMEGEVVPFGQAPNGPMRMFITGLWVVQALMLLLLLAVCGNTASLLLARASARRREVGVRLALGAGRGRVMGLLLTENLLLGLLGALVGAPIAFWATEVIRPEVVVGGFAVSFDASVDLAGLGVAMLLGVASGVAFGFFPATQLARVDPQEALRAGSQGSGRHWSRGVLMATEVALAMIVLLAAGIFLRGFRDTQRTETGFQHEGVMLVGYAFSGVPRDTATTRAFTARLLERLRTVPGVEHAAVASGVPLDIHGMPSATFRLEGRARSDATPDQALVGLVTPGYFATLRIPLRAGTDFAGLADPTAPPQVVVNEEFVARFLGAGEPLGRRLESRGQTFIITGVVANSLYESFGEPPKAITYFSYRDRPVGRGEIFLRTSPGSEAQVGAEAQRAIRELEPTLPVFDARTLAAHVDRNLFLRRVPAQVFGVVGPLLLLLAAFGIYAVVSYAVARRTTELGVRLALGGTTGRVTADLMGETLLVVGFGASAGWIVTFMVVRLFPGGSPDPLVFAVVPALVLLAAALASWFPARRVTRLDPMEALRVE